MTVRPALALVPLAAAVLVGCGSLNTGKAEGEIANNIKEQVGVTVASVDCPKDVKPKAGDVFTCAATGQDGTRATITVTQKDDKGNVSITAPLLNTARTQRSLAADIGGGVTLDCPDLISVEKGATFSCSATDAAGRQARVQVTFTDNQGNVTYKVDNNG
jgi:hypothetical protein